MSLWLFWMKNKFPHSRVCDNHLNQGELPWRQEKSSCDHQPFPAASVVVNLFHYNSLLTSSSMSLSSSSLITIVLSSPGILIIWGQSYKFIAIWISWRTIRKTFMKREKPCIVVIVTPPSPIWNIIAAAVLWTSGGSTDFISLSCLYVNNGETIDVLIKDIHT